MWLLSRGSNWIRVSNWIKYTYLPAGLPNTSPVDGLLISIDQLAQGPLYQQPIDRFSSLLDP